MAIYYILQPKTRKQIRDLVLFHEVTLANAPTRFSTADIEIVFNNEDRRFPSIGTDTVTVKWNMGSKKDALYLNGQATTLENWDNILKTAGFLRGNYFVIHQGETFRMAMFSPKDRLEMLEAFAGVAEHQKHYESSLADLQQSREDFAEITEDMDALTIDIETVSEQTKELAKFQELDRQKRLISHVLQNKTRIQIEDKLRKLRQKRAEESQELTDLVNNLKSQKGKHNNLLSRLEQAKSCIDSKKNERKSYQEDLESRTVELQKLTENIKTAFDDREKWREVCAKTKKELDEKITRKQTLQNKLDKTNSKLSKLQEIHDKIRRDVDKRQRDFEEFNAREGRRNLYDDPIEREEVIQKSITDLKSRVDQLKTDVEAVQYQMENRMDEKVDLETKINSIQEEIDTIRKNTKDLKTRDLHHWQKECGKLRNEDKLLQTDVIRLQEDENGSRNAMTDAWNKLHSKTYLRPFMDSITGMEKIFKYVKDNHEEVWIVLLTTVP